MSHVAVGRQAEAAAAEYLRRLGFKIIDTNWRTRYCEIDLIAEGSKIMHFVEVKYRLNNNQGNGLDYITTKKLAQMKFAAELWVQEHGWGGDYRLSAIEVRGIGFEIGDFLVDCNQ